MKASPFHFDELDIFRGLSAEAKDDLARRFEHHLIPGGERLINQGDEANNLHIVVSGRFSVSRDDGPVLATIARGEPVGEIAFFNGGSRTANVTALRDSEVLSIARADFDALADSQPILWRSTVVALAERLAAATDSTRAEAQAQPQPRTVVLCAAGGQPVPRTFGLDLVNALAALDINAALLDEATARSATGNADVDSPEMNRWLAVHEAAHDLVIWFAPGEENEWARKAVRQADAALLVGSTEPETVGGVERLVAARLPVGDTRIAARDGRMSDWLAPRSVGGHHLAQTNDEITALARFLCGRARGLVLGGGGALCGAHVAVVFALREAGVVFDSYGGTSAGAAVAATLALGLDRAEIIARCKDIFLTNRALKRWTVPKFGLVDPTTVDRMIQQHFGMGLIEDLAQPLFAVATDLADNACHIMDRGLLWEAIRASCSIPILLRPMIDAEGRILVDGGITDNLPVDPMRARKRGPNLAIMLGQAKWQRAGHRYADYPTRGQLVRQKLSPWKQAMLQAPGIGQILTRSMLLASDAASTEALNRTEAVFLPPLPKGMGITDWHRFEALEKDTFDWAKAEIDRRLTEDPTAFDAFL